MLDLDSCEKCYREDAQWKSVVDLLASLILDLKLAPSEIRSAAMYAAIRVEMRRPTMAILIAAEMRDREIAADFEAGRAGVDKLLTDGVENLVARDVRAICGDVDVTVTVEPAAQRKEAKNA